VPRGLSLILPTLLALGVLAISPGGAGSGAAHAATTVKPAAPSAAPPVKAPAQSEPFQPARYRIIGCLSRGSSAYLHGPRRREVAIGFDDGPWADTPAFLSMLERNGVRATFFMIGRQVTRSYASTLRRELSDGDVLGDHTWSHPDLTVSGQVRSQLAATISQIHTVSGYTPCVFRPPYGAYNGSVVVTASSLGLATVLWNVDPKDWATPGTAVIQARVLAQVGPGSIILSHDGGGPRGETLAAYPGIIRALRARGYRIVTIPELLGFPPVYRQCEGAACGGLGVPRSAVPGNAVILYPRQPKAHMAGP
jgi:peptidoglycan/xylan/chitin deacetylase (PgdA/CDA1 family)